MAKPESLRPALAQESVADTFPKLLQAHAKERSAPRPCAKKTWAYGKPGAGLLFLLVHPEGLFGEKHIERV